MDPQAINQHLSQGGGMELSNLIPQAHLRVINTGNFETHAVAGINWEAFLEERP